MSKSKQLTLRKIAVVLFAFVAAICMIFSVNTLAVKAEEGVVNGWVAYNSVKDSKDRFPFTSNFGFISGTDLGNGYTEMVTSDGNQDFVLEKPLDVTKPIVIEYNYSVGGWVGFGFIDNDTDYTIAQNASSLWGDTFFSSTAADCPEVGLVLPLGNESANFGGGEELRRYNHVQNAAIENKCGSARQAGVYTTLEIYFGTTDADGYIAVDGKPYATLTVNQSFFDSGEVILKFLTQPGQATLAIKAQNVEKQDSFYNSKSWAAYNSDGTGERFDFVNIQTFGFISHKALGNGYSEMYCGDGNQEFVHEVAFDITKPIVIEYNYSSNWFFFSLIDLADGKTVTEITNGAMIEDVAEIPWTGSTTDYPEVGFLLALGAESNIFGGESVGQQAAGLLSYKPTGATIVNKCGTARQEGVYTKLEIYFGATDANDGYVRADGVKIATPAHAQTYFESGKALLRLGFQGQTTVAVKAYNTAGAAYSVATDVNTGMSVDVAKSVIVGETVKATLSVSEGYRVTSLGYKVGDGAVTPFDKTGDYYQVGEYSFTMPAGDVTIVGVCEAYTITYPITKQLGNGISVTTDEACAAEASVTVSLSVSEGYRVTALGYKVGDNEITAFNKEGAYYTAGDYTFTMPAEVVTIVGESEQLFTVTCNEVQKGATASADKWFGEGETVTVALSVANNYKVTSFGWKTADSQVTEFSKDGEYYEAGDYTFTMPEGNVIIVATTQGFESRPDDVTKSKASYAGWDGEHATTYGAYGAYSDVNFGNWIFDKGQGMTTFMIDHNGAIGNVNALDVTKPIHIDFTMTGVDVAGGHGSDGWKFIYFADDWDSIVNSGVNLYTTSNFKSIIAWPDMTISSLENWGNGANWSDFDKSALANMENPFNSLAPDEVAPDTWLPTSFLNIEVYFGETVADGYLKMGVNGGDKVLIAKPTKVQSDFINGDVFMSFGAFFKTQAAFKVYQDASWVVDDANVSEHVTVEMITENVSALKTFDEVKFKLTCADGYGISKVMAGGVELTPDENGVYTHTCLFGVNALVVETGLQIDVTINVNGGSAVDSYKAAVGQVITAPESTKAGYTLEWYADEALTTKFDFTAPLTESVTLYAKWTTITYKINYYDGANKIRDLSKNNYTIEDTFTLETPTKEGFKFEGWYTDIQYTTEVSEISGSTGELTFYAKWSEKKAGCAGSVSASVIGVSVALVGAAFVAIKKRKED